MKSFFLYTLVGTVSAVSVASAFSLYDTAPAVGLPESQAARYFFSVSGGCDTNPQGSTLRTRKKTGYFANAALSTTFADVESVNKLSYNMRLGGTRYFAAQKSAGRKYYGDCGMSVSMVHAFSEKSRYSLQLGVTYTPEPGYDNGMSSVSMQGDTLSWNLSNTYSEAIDARWSWNVAAHLSGTKYEDSSYSYDDRQYYGGSFGVNYRESDRVTYTTSVSYRDEIRSQGLDSQSVFGALGIQYGLDPVSSTSLSLGAQCKMMDHKNTLNPTLDWGYRRRVTDGLSLNAYVKYSDENVDNYSARAQSSYRTSPTWRVGAYGTYVLSPDVSFEFRMQMMQTNNAKSTRSAMSGSKRLSFNPSASMNYNFTPSLMGSVMAEYTYYHYEYGMSDSTYNRWKLSTSLSYRF